jgi:hypothetical protein
VQLKRPHALAPTLFIQTPIGWISPGLRERRATPRFYLQGLPINVDTRASRFHSWPDNEIVHLDSPQFEGRLPERDSLLEPEANAKRIAAALDDVLRDHLTQLAGHLPEMMFLKAYGTLAAELGLRDLLNAMSAIPRQWVHEVVSTPVREGAGNTGYREHPAEPVARTELALRGVFEVCTDSANAYETDLRAALAVYARKGFMDSRIPEWHWAAAYVQEVAPEDFDLVPGTVIGEDSLEVYGESITLRLVESLALRPTDLPEVMLAIDSHYDPVEGVLFATPNAEAGIAVSQVSDFEDENDNYEEDEESAARQRFYATVQVLRHDDPAVLLRTFLDKALPWRVPARLCGRAFSVVLDDKGHATVTAAPVPSAPVSA